MLQNAIVKRTITIAICVILAVSLVTACGDISENVGDVGENKTASEAAREFNCTALNYALDTVCSLKEKFGVEDVDFNKLTTSDMIQIYDIDENGGAKKKNECLPLFYKGVLRMIAYHLEDGQYYISTIPKESDIKADTQMAFLVIDDDLAAYNNGTSAKYLTWFAHRDGPSINIADMGLNLDDVEYIDGTKNTKVVYEPSSSPANDTNNIAARQTDPNRPFVGITEKDIKSAYISHASLGEIYLSTDDISKMLDLASQVRIDPEKGEKWSLPLGGPCIILVELKDGRTLRVGGFNGDKSSKYYYNGLEYDGGDYDICEQFIILIDNILDNDPGYQKWLAEMTEKAEKEEKGES